MAKIREARPDAPLNRTSKLSDSERVIEFIDQCDHPLKEVLAAARETVLSANKEITEHIKWNAPSFCFNGEDRVTFNLHNRACILIVFHRGAKTKDGKTGSPLFQDPTGLLEWVTNDRATAKFYSLQDLNAKKELLKKALNQWVALKVE